MSRMEKEDRHHLFRNDHEAKEKALAAKQRALAEYTVDKMAQRYLEEYQKVLSRNRK